MTKEDRATIQRVAVELKSWDAVAVVGAGSSTFPGFPLTEQLSALVWHAIDADSIARQALAEKLKVPVNSGKHLIGDVPDRINAAYEVITEHPIAREKFQEGFANLNQSRLKRPSPAHEVIAELLHRQVIKIVVSLNWDTRLEAAFQQRYGRELYADDNWLYKPHGDARLPTTPWILPHETGIVPAKLVDRLTTLVSKRPHVLLVIGYSERDETIVEKLIQPIEEKWRVVRIGPTAKGELAIPLPAEEVMPRLLHLLSLDTEIPGWEYIKFDHQRDLGPALNGLRLGPEDVNACPRLPEVDRTKALLRTIGSTLIVGQSGSGKSVTAFQVGFDYSQQDWEVVRLRDPMRKPDDLESALSNLPYRTLAIVDDAQILDPVFLQRLLSRTSQEFHIVATSTESLPSLGREITIAVNRAVSIVAENLRERRNEVLPIVRQLDSRIGEGYLDESLEHRLAYAERNSKTPWEFCFCLTGGERRAKDDMVLLQEHSRSDLLLIAIAARQVVMQGAEVPFDWADQMAHVVERDHEWAINALSFMIERRILFPSHDDAIRCPHPRFAEQVLLVGCQNRRDAEWAGIVSTIRRAVVENTPPLGGLFRLFFELKYADAFRWAPADLVDKELLGELLDRCWTATDRGVGDAAYLLMALLRWRSDEVLAEIKSRYDLIGSWLTNADSDSAYGLAWLVNDTYNTSRSVAESLCAASDPAPLAVRFSRAPIPEWPALSNLVDRLVVGGGSVWSDAFRSALETEPLIEAAERVGSADIMYFSTLAKAISAVDSALALELVERASTAITKALSENPAETYHEINEDLFWFVLGFAPPFLRHKKPSFQQRQVAGHIARKLDLKSIAGRYAGAARREWRSLAELLMWLTEVDAELGASLISMIDMKALDETTEQLWPEFPHELKTLVMAFALEPDYEPAKSWVRSHTDDIEHLDPVIAIICPETVVARIKDGHHFDLELGSGLRWKGGASALARLAEIDKAAAVEVASANVGGISTGLRLPQADKCEGLVRFMMVIESLAPHVIRSAIAAIETDAAEKSWTERLRGKKGEKQAVTAILSIAKDSHGPIKNLAEKLMNQFPSTKR